MFSSETFPVVSRVTFREMAHIYGLITWCNEKLAVMKRIPKLVVQVLSKNV